VTRCDASLTYPAILGEPRVLFPVAVGAAAFLEQGVDRSVDGGLSSYIKKQKERSRR
jgi:hypothetical protein